MALFVRFWGTRGSIPTPGQRTQRFGGNTSCVELRTDDAVFICDAGTGLRELGLDLLRRFEKKPIEAHLFISHPHWDHIQGFPFFTPAYIPSNTLHVYGPVKGEKKIRDLLSGQMESSYFPVNFNDLGAKIVHGEVEPRGTPVQGVTVRMFRQFHPGGSLGFSFEHDGKKVVYSTDNEIDQTLELPPWVSPDLEAIRPIPADLIEFARDADLLIADGQYTDEEYPNKVGWGHPRATTLVDLAVQARVKQLAVFHHDPMQADADVDAKIALCHRRATMLMRDDLVIFGAREGLELKL